MTVFRLFSVVFLIGFLPLSSWAFDWSVEGRVKTGSSYIFDSPPNHKDFDSEAELRLGVLGNAWQNETWALDYELSGDAKLADGPSVQSGLRKNSEADFFRAWLRLGNERLKIRGGRQKILFGAGAIFRPLGFFDTRDVTGVVPETRGVDGVRATYFFDETTSLQGWAVRGRLDDHVIAGVRLEGLIAGQEMGVVVQYHPQTNLDDLAQFSQELVQLGYHIKGEKNIAYWNESRLDIEQKNGDDPLRFDTVLGADYTFNIGEGLHFLVEYFLSKREKRFSIVDPREEQTLQQMGFLFDMPYGIDIVWQVFGLYDIGDGSFQIVPQIEYSVTDQVFLYLSGRWGGSVQNGEKNGRLFSKTPVFNGTESQIGLTLVGYF
ncbi:MAG: hypothetical protein NPINA01_32840 [Nitrospinaceae bacterium]|nr:MAG: hypothetical protein NPINA01_32840 [Nitrospinaceae bacterium]